MSIKILMVEDHNMVRFTFRQLLDDVPQFEIVGEAADVKQAVQLARDLTPDIILMDIALSGNRLGGIDATRKICEADDNVGVIALSHKADSRTIESIIRAGASAYLLKTDSFDELLKAIKRVKKGDTYFSTSIRPLIYKRYRNSVQRNSDSKVASLSQKEFLVWEYIVQEYSVKEIADLLKIKAKTVYSHRQNVMKKLGVDGDVGLTLAAIREGILPQDDVSNT